MRKLSLAGLFIIVTVFVSQLENFQNAISTLTLNGIPPTFYLTMALGMFILFSLSFSLKYIRKIAKAR